MVVEVLVFSLVVLSVIDAEVVFVVLIPSVTVMLVVEEV